MNFFASPIDIKRIPTENFDILPPCAVILTVYEGSSYDSLFRTVTQSSPNPDFSIALFECSYKCLSALLSALLGDVADHNVVNDLVSAINKVDTDSVVFNFECCSGCSECGFNSHTTDLINFVAYALEKKHCLMFGDFSLKGLIKDWKIDSLGPNPFINLGTCDHHLQLKFHSNTLINCPNAQLQYVGRLCEEGEASLHCLGGTIVYTIAETAGNNEIYDIEILSIAQNHGNLNLSPDFNVNAYPKVSIERRGNVEFGTAGHVLLKYHNGGTMVTSAGHWIELSHLNVREDDVLRVAEMQMGQDYALQMQSEMNVLASPVEREQYVQRSAQRIVQSSAPCNYSRSSNR